MAHTQRLTSCSSTRTYAANHVAVVTIGRVEGVEILAAGDRWAVRGVRARLRGLHDAEFFADLVVDATGPLTRFGGWRDAGYALPEDFDAMTGGALEMVMGR